MKKLILILILIININILGFSQNKHSVQPKNNLNGFKNKYEAKNKTINGLKEGKWIDYRDKDEKKLPDSTGAKYYYLTIFKSDIPIGKQFSFYISGELYREKFFNSNGKEEGKIYRYYKNGTVERESSYKNGVWDGINKSYYPSGKLERLAIIINEQEEGISKEYYEDGAIKFEIPYTNGKKNGIEKKYDESGNLLNTWSYTNGVENITTPTKEETIKWLQDKINMYGQNIKEDDYNYSINNTKDAICKMLIGGKYGPCDHEKGTLFFSDIKFNDITEAYTYIYYHIYIKLKTYGNKVGYKPCDEDWTKESYFDINLNWDAEPNLKTRFDKALQDLIKYNTKNLPKETY